MEKMRVTPKSNVLIAGGGPMGMLFALQLASDGVRVTISEPVETRRAQVIALGVNAIAPETVTASDYDNIVVAVNLPPLVEEYVKSVGDNGTVHCVCRSSGGTVLSLDAQRNPLPGCYRDRQFRLQSARVSPRVRNYPAKPRAFPAADYAPVRTGGRFRGV